MDPGLFLPSVVTSPLLQLHVQLQSASALDRGGFSQRVDSVQAISWLRVVPTCPRWPWSTHSHALHRSLESEPVGSAFCETNYRTGSRTDYCISTKDFRYFTDWSPWKRIRTESGPERFAGKVDRKGRVRPTQSTSSPCVISAPNARIWRRRLNMVSANPSNVSSQCSGVRQRRLHFGASAQEDV